MIGQYIMLNTERSVCFSRWKSLTIQYHYKSPETIDVEVIILMDGFMKVHALIFQHSTLVYVKRISGVMLNKWSIMIFYCTTCKMPSHLVLANLKFLLWRLCEFKMLTHTWLTNCKNCSGLSEVQCEDWLCEREWTPREALKNRVKCHRSMGVLL